MTNELLKSPQSNGNGSEFAEMKLIPKLLCHPLVISIINIKGDVLHAKA
jgi:hypothetical protein